MSFRSLIGAVIAIAVFAIPAYGQNGDWYVTGGTLSGTAIPGDVVNSMTLTINNSTFTAKSAGKTSTGSVTIDNNAAPFQTMIFKITGGDDNGREIKSVFQNLNGTLSITFSKDTNFPSIMRSTAENKYLSLTYASGTRSSVAGNSSSTTSGLTTPPENTSSSGSGAAAGLAK